jgi:hypothetical protein
MDDSNSKSGEIITISKSPLVTSYARAREQGGVLIKKYRFSGITSILLAPLMAVGLALFLLIMFLLLFAAGIYFTFRFMLSIPQSIMSSRHMIEKHAPGTKKDVEIL